ncbi:diguanylate cyclase [Desulfobulbus alkaliphilus]|uniref:diguanylate cyclase n=1 Tax=Desulfobulbus alkaliphilus TaxID=869814 RepID=UPI001963F404|nr:diguanylate cyclase [Desulfobulbus alkaliphilus]MBM9538403.1 GGDEF domain-containing protein [Desulfobulbus alkaliphilus]
MHKYDQYDPNSRPFLRLTREELREAYRFLYQEVLVSREAATITAQLVVEQIAKVEEVNKSLERANEELKKLTNLDGLTGIANRRYHEDTINREWRRCQRTNSSLAAIMIDIDHFKLYNDHYGHLAGDQCLQQVARELRRGARRVSDSVARYGGEEFVCLMPDCSIEAAINVAKLIRQRIRKLRIPHATSKIDTILTVSQGVAAMVPSRDTVPSELIQRADQALYQAKLQGRDRVVVYDESMADSAPKVHHAAGTDSNNAWE